MSAALASPPRPASLLLRVLDLCQCKPRYEGERGLSGAQAGPGRQGVRAEGRPSCRESPNETGTGEQPGTGRPIGGTEDAPELSGGRPAPVWELTFRTGLDSNDRGGDHARQSESGRRPEAGAIALIALLPRCISERGYWTPSGGKSSDLRPRSLGRLGTAEQGCNFLPQRLAILPFGRRQYSAGCPRRGARPGRGRPAKAPTSSEPGCGPLPCRCLPFWPRRPDRVATNRAPVCAIPHAPAPRARPRRRHDRRQPGRRRGRR